MPRFKVRPIRTTDGKAYELYDNLDPSFAVFYYSFEEAKRVAAHFNEFHGGPGKHLTILEISKILAETQRELSDQVD